MYINKLHAKAKYEFHWLQILVVVANIQLGTLKAEVG